MTRIDSTSFRESPVRSFVDWTPGLLRSARHMADGGQLRLAADLCEALLGDSRVQGVLGTRVLGLLGLPLHFTPADESLAAGKATKALEQDFWKAFPEADLAQLVSWGVLLGVGVGEIIWEPQGERVIPRLKVWHPRWLRWDWEQRKWFLALDGGAEVPIEPGANKWILFTPYGAHRPWTHGAWRACAQPWLMKQLAVQDWARHAEVHGSPVRVGTAPEGASAEVRAQVAADFAKLGADTAICLPEGFDLRFEEASGGSWQMFKAELDWSNTEIAIALAGQNLTSEVAGGSYAAASVHQAIRQDLIEADARTLSTCLREQVVRWWAEYNLGKAELAPWPEWETEPPQRVQGTAQALGAIAQAVGALKQIGVEVDSRALLERTGVGVTGGEAEHLTSLAGYDPLQARAWNGRWTRVQFIEGPDQDGSGEASTKEEIANKTGSDRQQSPSSPKKWKAKEIHPTPTLRGRVKQLPGFALLSPKERKKLDTVLQNNDEVVSLPIQSLLRKRMMESDLHNASPEQQAKFLREVLTSRRLFVTPHTVPISEGGLDRFKRNAQVRPDVQTIDSFHFHSEKAPAVKRTVEIEESAKAVYFPTDSSKKSELEYPTLEDMREVVSIIPRELWGLVTDIRVNPGLYPSEPSALGSADESGHINIYPAGKRRKVAEYQGTVIHEIGHVLSRRTWGADTSDARWNEWRRVMAADDFGASPYSFDSIEEDFSETFKAYWLVVGTEQESRVRRLFPAKFAIIDRLVKRLRYQR